MKKAFKKKSKKIADHVNLIHDPKLDQIKLEDIAPPKVAEFNKRLPKLKLPKELL